MSTLSTDSLRLYWPPLYTQYLAGPSQHEVGVHWKGGWGEQQPSLQMKKLSPGRVNRLPKVTQSDSGRPVLSASRACLLMLVHSVLGEQGEPLPPLHHLS